MESVRVCNLDKDLAFILTMVKRQHSSPGLPNKFLTVLWNWLGVSQPVRIPRVVRQPLLVLTDERRVSLL